MGGSPTLCFPILVSKLVTFLLHFCTRLWVYWSSQHMNTAPNHTIGRGTVPQLLVDGICIIYHDCIDPLPSCKISCAFVSTYFFIQEFVAGTDLFIG